VELYQYTGKTNPPSYIKDLIGEMDELNYEDVLNEQLNNAAVVAAKGLSSTLSSTYTNAYINNSIYGYYNVYDGYPTNLVVDYDGRLIGY